MTFEEVIAANEVVWMSVENEHRAYDAARLAHGAQR